MHSPIAVRQKAILSNTDKPSRQNVLNEASEELFSGKRHLPVLVAVSVIFPAEGHPTVVEGQQTMARDSDPVRVACKVLQYVFWPTEWFLGVHHPVGSI